MSNFIFLLTTFHRVFANLDTEVFEEVVGNWLAAITPLEKGEGIGLDGKSLHGTNLHLVSAFAHLARAVLFEQGTDTKGKELVVGPEVLTHITIKDQVVTGDALFAQRTLCEQIRIAQGGYVFRVKGNQDTLEKNIRLFFTDPPFQVNIQKHTTIDKWKGVREIREVRVSTDTRPDITPLCIFFVILVSEERAHPGSKSMDSGQARMTT